MANGHRGAWTFAITSMAVFMGALDNLVVTTALPVIREDLNASLADLEWTVNAYTLSFAVLLLTGAALGDRFGRKRVFLFGLAVFTASSAAAAMASTTGELLTARAVQGVGAAIVAPLSLTLLSASVSPERRGLALGGWGAVSGLAVALGPLVGGAVVDGASWEWIFWLNVPIGIVLLPLGYLRLTESHGRTLLRLDIVGTALASAGLFGIVLGLVRANTWGWGSTRIITLFVGGGLLLVAFLIWERRTAPAMLPLHLFRSRSFSAANTASLLMYFGMFGAVFLLAQFLQVVQGYSPFEAGLRTLPWTGMPALVAPIAGALTGRLGGHRIVAAGLALQAVGLAWLASLTTVAVPYGDLVPAFVLCGVGMGMFFAPAANLVLSSVRRDEEGIASGANNALRELGGVFGVAVLASVFAHNGDYASGQAYVDGLVPAVWVGAGVVAAGSVVALAAGRPNPMVPATEQEIDALEPAAV